ncbi:MAG: DUF4058 family protein [Chloroflexota bacterium]
MTLRAKTNLYPGVNPHLNSWLQRSGDRWRGFHGKHITYLAEFLDSVLPEGYYTRDEASLNIGRIDAPEITVPDVSIYREREQETRPTDAQRRTPTLTLPLPTLTDTMNEPRALVIYRVRDTDDEPVTRIEVLSPSNKPGGSYYGTYMKKRELTLESGLNVVEIDYLHETSPVVTEIPDYSAGATGAYPYHVLVSVPRPSYAKGYTDVHSVALMEKFQPLAIPLLDGEWVNMTLNSVYNRIFEAVRQYQTVVDYAQEPDNMAAYTEEDQQHIRVHMAKIAATQNP